MQSVWITPHWKRFQPSEQLFIDKMLTKMHDELISTEKLKKCMSTEKLSLLVDVRSLVRLLGTFHLSFVQVQELLRAIKRCAGYLVLLDGIVIW